MFQVQQTSWGLVKGLRLKLSPCHFNFSWFAICESLGKFFLLKALEQISILPLLIPSARITTRKLAVFKRHILAIYIIILSNFLYFILFHYPLGTVDIITDRLLLWRNGTPPPSAKPYRLPFETGTKEYYLLAINRNIFVICEWFFSVKWIKWQPFWSTQISFCPREIWLSGSEALPPKPQESGYHWTSKEREKESIGICELMFSS